MLRRLLLIAGTCMAALCAYGQTGPITGFCDQGATQATTSGSKSSNYQQGDIPSCTVTVYLTGTTNLATIYSDANNTVLGNPFTASTIGQYLFYAALGQNYDIVLSGGNPPNVYTTPLTKTGIAPSIGPQSPVNVNPLQYGAKANMVVVLDGNITGGSAVLTTTTSTPFNCATDVGKAIGIVGAGAYSVGNHNLGLQLIPTTLVSTIASCQSNKQVTLASTAPINSGVVTSITYTSGIATTGSKGQTCLLTGFNGWTGGTATVTLTGTNTIATGTAVLITALGAAASSNPTSATAGNGTAVCSGTVTVASTVGAASVTNQWTAFGTDDGAAVRACVNNGTNLGGVCTISDGKAFMVSNTSSTIAVLNTSGIEGGTISGRGTIGFMPQGSLTGGTNDRLFFVQSNINSSCTSATANVCTITSAPLAKGATSFTASAGDGALLSAGQWAIIEEIYSPGGCCNYIDWVKVQSVATSGGTATVTLTQPLEMSFPQDTNNALPDIVGFRPITQLASHLTLRDFTVLTPMLYDGTAGRWANTLNTQGTYGLTIKGVKCWNASKNCLATDYDNALKIEDNYWHIEGIGTEIANSVHNVITGNTFAKQASAINQNQSVCAGGFSPSGLNVDLATAFSSIANNQVDGCQVGQYLLQGAHDNTVNNNKYSWMAGPNPAGGYLCVGAIGSYNNLIEGNNCVGANSSNSIGIVVEDSTVNPALKSNQNQVLFNTVDPATFTTTYSMIGTLGTDCYSALSGGSQIGTCFISPTANNTFTGTQTFWNMQDAIYNAIILQSGKTATQVTNLYFSDWNATQEWDLEKDSANGFRIRYVPANLPILLFSAAGQTAINSQGTNNICFQCSAGVGTGGVLTYSGGTAPYPVHTISSVGLTAVGGDLKPYSNLAMTALAAPSNGTWTTASTGGTLSSGTYYYRIAAINTNGTTLASTEASQVVPIGTSTNTVTLNWIASFGATGYNVYGRSTGAELLMTPSPLAASVLTFTDTGSVSPSGALPSANTTQGGVSTASVGSGTASNTDITGRLALSGGTGTYTLIGTYSSAPNCVCNDVTTAANACSVSESTTTLTFTGTSTDTVKYLCFKRN